jgi:hypothetical protein
MFNEIIFLKIYIPVWFRNILGGINMKCSPLKVIFFWKEIIITCYTLYMVYLFMTIIISEMYHTDE